MFGSRKRMKRGGGHLEKDVEGTPAAKKIKGNTGWLIYVQRFENVSWTLACDYIPENGVHITDASIT